MYFPYLRGRQFELLALRELIDYSALSRKVIPIIEPVKLTSTLIKTLDAFNKNKRNLALVRNPGVGSFVNDLKKEDNALLKEKFFDLITKNHFFDAFILNPKVVQPLKKYLGNNGNAARVITLCNNEDNVTIYENIFSEHTPRYNLIPDEGAFRREIRENRVMLANKFRKLSRNTDYAENDDEPFSADHIYYSTEGYLGFSDYSVIGDEYVETGFAPYAVAIHIVYFDNKNKLRIKHFVSDTNDDISNPAGKFAEAVTKLVEWNKIKNLDTIGINAFVKMYENEMYPGLGTVKKLSLMHHFELLSRYLDER